MLFGAIVAIFAVGAVDAANDKQVFFKPACKGGEQVTVKGETGKTLYYTCKY